MADRVVDEVVLVIEACVGRPKEIVELVELTATAVLVGGIVTRVVLVDVNVTVLPEVEEELIVMLKVRVDDDATKEETDRLLEDIVEWIPEDVDGELLKEADEALLGAADEEVLREAVEEVPREVNGEVLEEADEDVLGEADGDPLGAVDEEVCREADEEELGASDEDVLGGTDEEVLGKAAEEVPGADEEVLEWTDCDCGVPTLGTVTDDTELGKELDVPMVTVLLAVYVYVAIEDQDVEEANEDADDRR